MCRGFQPVMGQMSHAAPQAYPLPYNFMPCYPAAQYSTAQAQGMPPVTVSYVAAPMPYGYNQSYPGPQVSRA